MLEASTYCSTTLSNLEHLPLNMLSLSLLPPAILFAATTMAQIYPKPAMNALMNVSFGEGTNSNCDENGGDSGLLSLAILTAPQTGAPVCFNLNETFSNPQTNYSTGGLECQSEFSCGVSYQVIRWSVPFSQHNYSQVYYSQTTNAAEEASESDEKGRLTLQTYNGLNCLQVGGEPSENGGQIQPWYRWDCNSNGDCADLPYSVRSFSIWRMDSDDVGDDDCSLAQSYGSSVSGSGQEMQARGFTVLAVAFMALAFLA